MGEVEESCLGTCCVFRISRCGLGRASALHSLDHVWRRVHAAPSSVALGSHRLRGVGRPYRTPALDLPFDMGRKLAEGEGRACAVPGRVLLHYLDALVYPNISAGLLTDVGVAVCLFNLGIYAFRLRRRACGLVGNNKFQMRACLPGLSVQILRAKRKTAEEFLTPCSLFFSRTGFRVSAPVRMEYV